MDLMTKVLVMLAFLQRRFGRNSVTISQRQMLKILEERYDEKISRRTLCRALKKARGRKFIVSQRRHYRSKAGTFIARASNHMLTCVAAWVAPPFRQAYNLLKALTAAPKMAHSLLKTPDIKKEQEVTASERCPPTAAQRAQWPWNRATATVK